MVVEMLSPDTAPLWLNVFIWMALFWWYILLGFIPAFYIAITKLFGFPLLQRWSKEVVIMLYPSNVKFGKITQQYEPYFKYKKGVYWVAEKPIQPIQSSIIPPKYNKISAELKEKYETLALKINKPGQPKTDSMVEAEKEMAKIMKQQKRIERKTLTITPVNPIHIFTHAMNQEIFDTKRRESKVDEILNNDPNPKKISGHGIWLMQHPKLHFHRHFQVILDHNFINYVIVPVKERQQFGIGFWHSLGIVIEQEVKTEQDIDSGSGGKDRQLQQTMITTHVIIQQMKQVQDYQNFSASRAFMLLKRRAKIEGNFMTWLKGDIPPMVWLVLGGAVAVVAIIYIFLGHSPTPTGADTGIHPIL